MSKQTAMQELKSTVKNIICEMNGQLSEYDSGYKQCLIGLMNDINYRFMKMEQEQIQDAYVTGAYLECGDSKQYYNETYGGNNE
jgi:hypothetical protein